MIKNLRDFIFGKMFFPKVAVIDKPGIIISKSSSKYGGRESKRRNVWIFEDTLANLQLETIKEIGKEKTDELWYKIGKDASTRYLLLAKVKKVPDFLFPLIIEYIFNNLRTAGLSAAEKIEYKKDAVTLRGKDNVICRKSNVGSLMSGVVSGIVSCLKGYNIEADSICNNCPNKCSIILSEKIRKKYIPRIARLIPAKDYYILNFLLYNKFKTTMFSFSDLYKFKKIWVDKSGKFFYLNLNILPIEIGWCGLASYHYEKINRIDVFKKGIVEESEKIARTLLNEIPTIAKKIETILNILCAFGWGIPYYKKEDNVIIFDFVCPPITEYGFLYYALVLNGILNYCFNKKFSIKNIKTSLNPPNIKICYS